MRKYLAWDKKLERVCDVIAIWGSESIIVKSPLEEDESTWLNQYRFVLMQYIGRRDTEGKELHEGAVVKGINISTHFNPETGKDVEVESSDIGVIEYDSDSSCYILRAGIKGKIPLLHYDKFIKYGIVKPELDVKSEFCYVDEDFDLHLYTYFDDYWQNILLTHGILFRKKESAEKYKKELLEFNQQFKKHSSK